MVAGCDLVAKLERVLLALLQSRISTSHPLNHDCSTLIEP